MNEAETRQQIIDRRLRLAGWDLADRSQVIDELPVSPAAPPPGLADPSVPYRAASGFSDYGLLLDGVPAAVVEAKKTALDARVGQEQALQYAQNLQASQGGSLPLVFYTNGHEIHFWEAESYPPWRVHGFPTPDDLRWMRQRHEQKKPLAAELIDSGIVERDYQIAAIRAVLEGVEARRRKFLLVMATGTGKTRVATSLVDVLRRARWIRRVLFLVDRRALAEQALDAFKEFIPAEPRWPDRDEQAFARDRRLYVATYPTMLNRIQAGTTPATWISPFFFDLVIADESHRSIYDVYRQVLDYFHALKLGLTATPRDSIEHDTFQLFECPAGDPTFVYTYEEAVAHRPPYLCRYEVLKVRTRFQLEGIQGGRLPESVRQRLVAEGLDPDDMDFEGTDLERKVTNAGTNALIVREFMEECIKDPTGTLPGKSIFFAISRAHARRIHELFDALYPEHRGRLARVLVSEDPRVHGKGGLLDQFKNKDMPRVAISVDLLDSGVDVREVVNLVFAKPVYSYTKFWQMIGRGTRVLPPDPSKRKPWCPEKDRFLILDCWGNFDFFGMTPEGREPGQQVPLPVRLFRARLDRLEAAIAAGDQGAIAACQADLRADLADLPENNVVVLEHARQLAEVASDEFWTGVTPESLGHLRGVIAPVLRARAGVEPKAMRFELEVVEAGTALLSGDTDRLAALAESLRGQVGELPLAVNVVAREKALIEEVLTDGWWKEIADERLRDLSRRLVPLMKYRQARTQDMLALDLQDLVAVKERVEFGPEHERMSTSAYRARIEAAIQAMVKESPALGKLASGLEPTDAEIQALADELASHDPYVTLDLLRRVYDHRKARFIQFMKHILGLEPLGSWPEAVTQSFDDFLARHTTYTSVQIRFLKTLRTFVIQRGAVQKKDLIAAPFTQLHPKGIRGVFRPKQVEEILDFTADLVA